jgi:hypothetical protein
MNLNQTFATSSLSCFLHPVRYSRSPSSLIPLRYPPISFNMAASRVIDELVLVQDLQRSVLRHGNLKSYRVFQLPRLPVATSLHMRTSTTHRRRYHRLGESSFKRLVHTLVYSLCTGTASAEEAELHKVSSLCLSFAVALTQRAHQDICLTLLSVPTCSAVMQKAFQHDPSSPFDGLPDVPEDLESFLVYLNAVISSHDQGYLRAYAWFDPVYRPLAKACIKAM